MKHLEGRINTQILGVRGLSGTNPAMEDAEVNRKVCFKHKSIGYCYRSVQIKVSKVSVDPTIFTNFSSHQLVICATVVQTDVEENNSQCPLYNVKW